MNNYDDIINMDRPISNRPKMSLYNRAAQFSPFSALTGYNDEIKETSRIVDKKIELSDDSLKKLDLNLSFIINNITKHPLVKLTYFVSDSKKNGGTYIEKTGNVRKIDIVNGVIHLTDNEKIKMNDIIDIATNI
ncbi:MAG: hypothetical protein J6D28_01520 [Bacilli bacterium]|nr:hypothetical protein [Bacilli bacterium]